MIATFVAISFAELALCVITTAICGLFEFGNSFLSILKYAFTPRKIAKAKNEYIKKGRERIDFTIVRIILFSPELIYLSLVYFLTL